MRFYPCRFYQSWKEVVPDKRNLLTFVAKSINRTKSFVLLATREDFVRVSWRNFFWMQIQVRFLQRGKPLAYILGEHPFCTSTFIVNSNVLIPRVETEFFLERIFKKKILTKNDNVLDIGVGSGALSIELIKKLGCRVVGLDISQKAVQIAKLNQKKLLQDRMYLFHIEKGDIGIWISQEKFTTIISNPPYIASMQIQTLETSVRNWEPKVALDGGESGIQIFEKIFARLPTLLQRQGNLFLEFSPEQAKFLEKVSTSCFKKVVIEKDQFFRERYLFATGYNKG